MDVVKRSIQALGGRISIASRPGKGSTFTLSLPLTLAVLDGMVVTVAEPDAGRAADRDRRDPAAEGRATCTASAATHAVISIRDTFVPLIDVGRGARLPRRRRRPGDQASPSWSKPKAAASAALLVDAIQGQRQVVIKSLEANYRHVPGIAAATILGDGRVALILDVDAIVAGSRGESLPRNIAATAG